MVLAARVIIDANR